MFELITVDVVTGIDELRVQSFEGVFSQYGYSIVTLFCSFCCISLSLSVYLRSNLVGAGVMVALTSVMTLGISAAVEMKVGAEVDRRYDLLKEVLVEKDMNYLIYHARSPEVTVRSRAIAVSILNEKYEGWELSSADLSSL